MGNCNANYDMGYQTHVAQKTNPINSESHKEAYELLPNRIGNSSPCRLDSMKMLPQCERRDDICATEKTKTINNPAWGSEGGEALINKKMKTKKDAQAGRVIELKK